MNKVQVLKCVLALTVAGCAAPSGEVEDASLEEIGAAAEAVAARVGDAVPAYFDYDNQYAVADDASAIYAKFNSYPGKVVTVEVSQQLEADDASVGLRLYQVMGDGRLRLRRAAWGLWGTVWTAIVSQGTGSYVVEMVSSGELADLVLNVSCVGDDCSPDAQPGDFCGGRGGVACAEGLHCSYAEEAACGVADQGGVCAVSPRVCTKEYAPVCGCDGQTYGNACVAASAGISVRGQGECPRPVAQLGESCGGFTLGPAPTCAEGLYCDYRPEDVCGFADAPGTCAKKPDVCTQEVAPVCGCDGQTYTNACDAARHGAAVAQRGECPSAP